MNVTSLAASDDDARDSTVFFIPPFVPLFSTPNCFKNKNVMRQGDRLWQTNRPLYPSRALSCSGGLQ